VVGGATRNEVEVSVTTLAPASKAVFGLALIATIPVRKNNPNQARIKNKENLSLQRTGPVTKDSHPHPCYLDTFSICNLLTAERNRNISAGHEGGNTQIVLS
jgi:hypothetical protein